MAVTVGVLWYLLSIVPIEAIVGAIGSASPLLVAAGVSLQIVVRLLNALRIRIVARAQDAPLSYRAILSALFTTAFYALILPGAVGGGAATFVKYLGHGVTPAAALANMIVNRFVETATVVTVGVFWWGFDRGSAAGGARVASAAMLAGPLLLLAFHGLVFGRAQLLARLASLASAERMQTNRFRGLVAAVARQGALVGSLPGRAAARVALQSLLQDFVGSLSAFCFARAAGIDLSFATVAWMRAVVALLLMLPISFSGVGIRDSALVVLTGAYGIAGSLAIAWSFLQFGGMLFIASIGGLVEARHFWRRPA